MCSLSESTEDSMWDTHRRVNVHATDRLQLTTTVAKVEEEARVRAI